MPSSCRVWTIVTPILQDHQDTLLTRRSVYWTLQCAIVTGTCKFDYTACHTCCMRSCNGSIDVPERIQYKLGVIVHCCLQNKAPEYLVDCCTPVSDIPSRRRHGQSLDFTWPLHVTGSALSVFGPSLSLVRRSGTRCRTVSVTRRSAATVSDNCWRRSYSDATTQHTQRSRDASWFCAINYWYW